MIPDTASEKPTFGKVIAVGQGKVLENGKTRGPDIKVGDRVLFSKYSGTEVKGDPTRSSSSCVRTTSWLWSSMEEPLRQIVANAGDDAAVVLNRVREGEGNFGYNAANSEFGDMIELGILDPTKVTRLALQNAASVAGLFLTTEASIAEAPKDKSHAAAHGPPDDMDI